jgi:3-dehydroquinate dehydratase
MASISRVVCIDDENGRVEVSASSVEGVRITLVHTGNDKRTRIWCPVGFAHARAFLAEALRMIELAEAESLPAK